MKHAIAIRHLALEDLGILTGLLEARGYRPAYLDAGIDDLANVRLDRHDLLVVLGGPIGAYEDDRYPFLVDELHLIEDCLRRDVPILGICLGAQLLARALGARVYPGPAKEIGYAPIDLTNAGRMSCLAKLQDVDCNVLHWHGDTYDLPAGAVRLASTAATPNQAFSVGERVLALQFHIEANPTRIESWLIGHACELAAAGIDPRTLRQQRDCLGHRVAVAGGNCLKAWLALAAPPVAE